MAEIFTKVIKFNRLDAMKQINLAILKSELHDLLESINEQTETLIYYEGKIPRIEFDIIMDNMRKMYDGLQLLYRLNNPAEIKFFSDQENKENTPAKMQQEQSAQALSSNKQQLENDPLLPPKKSDNSTAASLFVVEDLSLTQKLQEAREKSMGTGFREKLPRDLKSLININEKFLFINELFGGNLRDYAQMIDRFNGLKEKKEAFSLLEELLKKHYWDTQSAAFKKFREVIERRFA